MNANKEKNTAKKKANKFIKLEGYKIEARPEPKQGFVGTFRCKITLNGELMLMTATIHQTEDSAIEEGKKIVANRTTADLSEHYTFGIASRNS